MTDDAIPAGMDEFTTVEAWEHDDQRELSLLYNHRADDSLQFNRGQMRLAIRHGRGLAAAAPKVASDTGAGAPSIDPRGIQCLTCGKWAESTSGGHCVTCIKSYRVDSLAEAPKVASDMEDMCCNEDGTTDFHRSDSEAGKDLIAGVKRALQDPDGEHDGWTDHGLKHAFFRWPTIVHAINAALAEPKVASEGAGLREALENYDEALDAVADSIGGSTIYGPADAWAEGKTLSVLFKNTGQIAKLRFVGLINKPSNADLRGEPA